MTKFTIEKWRAHVQHHRITLGFIVPPVALLQAKHPVVDTYDLSSLRMMTSGAAPLTLSLFSRTKVGIKQGYGLSETSPAAYQEEWEGWHTAVGSVGKLLPNMEVKYMTMPEDGPEPNEVSRGEIGELYLRGPNVFLGYHQNPTVTQDSLSADGWFQTGGTHGVCCLERKQQIIRYQ